MKRYIRILAILCAILILGLSGCSSAGQADPDGITEAEPTQIPLSSNPITLTLACLDEDLPESLDSWVELAAQRNITLNPVTMSVKEYNALSARQRPDIIYCSGQKDLESISDIMERDLVRRFPITTLMGTGTDQIRLIMNHYKPLYHDGYGFLALPQEAWDDTIAQPDGQVIYFRYDWLSNMKGVDFNNLTWENFMDMITYASLKDPDGNSVKDTRAVAVSRNLEDWLLDLFGVRDWVLENGEWIPGAVSQRARDALSWANQIRKEDRLLVCETNEESLEAFANGKVAMLLWDGTAQGVSQLEQAWNDANGTDGKKIEDCVAILPQPATPYGTRYLSVTQSSAFMMFDAAMDDDTLQRVFQVAQASWEESKAALDVYEPESYAEGVRDEMAAGWWVNAWKGPVFAMGAMSDDKIELQNQLHDSFPKTIQILAFSTHFESDWNSWVDKVSQWECYGPACTAVNELATERKFRIEE